MRTVGGVGMTLGNRGREMRPIHRNKGLTVGIVFFLSATIAGCGENSAMFTAVQTLRAAAFGAPETEIDRAQTSTIPYALVTARVGDLPAAILVLGYDEPFGQQWFSTNAVSLTTRHGRLIQSVGMPRDIRETRQLGNDPLAESPQDLDGTQKFIRELAGWSPNETTSVIRCVVQPDESERIIIAGLEFDTRRISESCRDDTGFDFENTYWVDVYDGFVWRSRQRWGRGGPVIEIAVLKPPGEESTAD